MAIKQDILQEICNVAKHQIQDLYPELKTLFVSHENGALPDVVSLRDFEMPKHPAAKVAQSILEKNCNRDETGFIGIAINQEEKWFGLSVSDSLLGIFNINVDEFSGARDFRRALYHHIWHAIDLVEVRKRPEFSGKFKSGPMIPKRSPMNLARLNLQADAFAATMCSLLGEEDSINILALKRAEDSITPSHFRKTEDFPFPIALEAMDYAYRELKSMKPSKLKYMFFARQLAAEVGRSFDDSNIRQWWGFSEPAQEMAWRGFSPDIILGCAIHTSEDAFVRGVGHLVCDITNRYPSRALEETNSFNAFANKEKTQLLHRELMEKAFEEAIAKGVYEESGQPLIVAANKQNEDMADGLIMGWCASALQAAARAFDGAIKSGISPTQAARMEFEGSKDSTNWNDLEKIGQAAIEQKRKGFAVTLGNIAEICSHNNISSPILGSIKMTMADTAHIQKLESANDLGIKNARPQQAPTQNAPVPKTPTPNAPSAPIASATFSAPGLGGNSANRIAAANAARHGQMAKEKTEKETSTE